MTAPTPPDVPRVISETLAFYGETLDWLVDRHAAWARDSDVDLAAAERENAIWKLSGQSIAHGFALVDLLKLGYTGQTWPTMRAIHEVDRILVVHPVSSCRHASRTLPV